MYLVGTRYLLVPKNFISLSTVRRIEYTHYAMIVKKCVPFMLSILHNYVKYK